MMTADAIKYDDRVHIAVYRDGPTELAVHRQVGGRGFNAIVKRFMIESRKLGRAGGHPYAEIDVRRVF